MKIECKTHGNVCWRKIEKEIYGRYKNAFRFLVCPLYRIRITFFRMYDKKRVQKEKKNTLIVMKRFPIPPVLSTECVCKRQMIIIEREEEKKVQATHTFTDTQKTLER